MASTESMSGRGGMTTYSFMDAEDVDEPFTAIVDTVVVYFMGRDKGVELDAELLWILGDIVGRQSGGDYVRGVAVEVSRGETDILGILFDCIEFRVPRIPDDADDASPPCDVEIPS